MNLSDIGGVIALQAYCNAFDNATLNFYGSSSSAPSIPSTPESAANGTITATFTFSATAFAAPTISSDYAVAVANFTTATITPSSTGYVGYARAVLESAATWATDTAYSVGAVVNNTKDSIDNWYVALVAGTSATSGNGPSVTGTGILDGTVVWMFIGTDTGDGVLADFTVGTSGSDITVGNTQFQTGVQVDLSSFKIQVPVV
jgi:hypothetical protein